MREKIRWKNETLKCVRFKNYALETNKKAQILSFTDRLFQFSLLSILFSRIWPLPALDG